MGLHPIFLKARDLPDAWFQAVDACLEHGRSWTVQQGSYEGTKRHELDYITIHITHPGNRPLVPEWPPHLSYIPPPTTMEYVENEYVTYLMGPDLKEKEVYSYGNRLAGKIDLWERKHYGLVLRENLKSQIDTVVERFKRNHGTNQCSMSIAQPSDIHLEEPPCWRELDARIIAPDGLKEGEEPELHFVVYFRSNDAWSGFPANMAGIRLLQEDMAHCIGVKAGEIVYSSKGFHIYQHAWDIAKLRVSR